MIIFGEICLHQHCVLLFLSGQLASATAAKKNMLAFDLIFFSFSFFSVLETRGKIPE